MAFSLFSSSKNRRRKRNPTTEKGKKQSGYSPVIKSGYIAKRQLRTPPTHVRQTNMDIFFKRLIWTCLVGYINSDKVDTPT
jgi:hypothetical protein